MREKVSKNISSVIFDLGGVLFDIDYTLTQKAFIDIGAVPDFNSIYSQQKQAGVFDDFEKGTIPTREFRRQVKQWLPPNISDLEIDKAWNAMLLGFPSSKIDLLKRLGKRYRLFLLSNTNEIHLPEVMKMMAHLDGNKGIEHLFEKCYYSCRIGMRKPDKVIFDKVCNENSLSRLDTLFVDDIIQNIEGANNAGLNTLHYTANINLEDYFG